MSAATVASAIKKSKSKSRSRKGSSAAAKKKVTTSPHPPTSVMVNNSLKNLKDRGGSSLQAIKKYISSAYKVDAEKASPFIKKYLKKAADEGKLTQTKGKGASGSFKIPSTTAKTASVDAPRKSISVVKLKKPKAPKKTTSAKPKIPRKKSVKPKKAGKKSSLKKKSPSKGKKVAKKVVIKF